MQQVVLESLKKYGTDPVLVFWKAVGEIMEDRLAEGMRSLQTIKDKRDVILCSSMALVYAHKRCSTIGKKNTSKKIMTSHTYVTSSRQGSRSGTRY